MSRRVYVYDFFDIIGNYTKLESEKNLKELEWQVLVNEHNIDMLHEKRINRDKPPMRDPIKKRR